MSTLTTRISGYKFTIVWEGQRAIGMFNTFDPNNGIESIHDLPFELRSTYSQKDGQTIGILAGAADAADTLNERVTYAAEYHHTGCDCDACRISLGMLDRGYGTGRGSVWMTKAYSRVSGRSFF